jgi:LysM repeat protein
LAVQYPAAKQRRGRITRLLAPALLVAVVVAVWVVVRDAPGSFATHPRSGKAAHSDVRHLRPVWTVRPGDTLAQIAQQTGLTINRLEVLNPKADPNSLLPGERLNLWRHPPSLRKPRRKPLGPLFWTVRSGQSFGSIAATTGIDLATLQHLNPRLRAAALQPGDRVRLRHGAPLGELLWGRRGEALAAAWNDLSRGESKPNPTVHTKARRSIGLF